MGMTLNQANKVKEGDIIYSINMDCGFKVESVELHGSIPFFKGTYLTKHNRWKDIIGYNELKLKK